MLPKSKHLEGLDSLGMNDQFKNDLTALWRWLNDDLHFHCGLNTPFDSKTWYITANCGKVAPRQTNTWDCGLYAISMGFCCALQALFTEITPHQIHTYCQKCILYLLDDDKTNGIMLPNCNWHHKVHLQSRYFPGEAERLYNLNVPQVVVDVSGDGNCLYYCMLGYLVQTRYLNDEWIQSSHPAVWMRQQIRKYAENNVTEEEWLLVTLQKENDFISGELDLQTYH